MNFEFDTNIDKPRNLDQNSFFFFIIILILGQVGWDWNTDLCLNIIPKHLNFEYDQKINKRRNLDQKCLHFLYNYTHLRGRLRFKPDILYT